MNEMIKRNPLFPWHVGIVILLIADAKFAYYIATNNCSIPNPIVVGLLVLLPALYFALMYLALKSQP